MSTKFGHRRSRIKGTIVVIAKLVHNPQFSTNWLALHFWDRKLMISFSDLHKTHTTPANIPLYNVQKKIRPKPIHVHVEMKMN